MENEASNLGFDLSNISIEMLAPYGLKLAGAVAIFVIGRWIAKLITRFARRMLANADVEDTLEYFIGNIINVLLQIVVIIAAVQQLGVETASMLALLGTAGLAIGLALQGSLSNFASGVLIVGFKPYTVGDFIEAAGVAGKVVEVQIFATVLKSADNKHIIVPNSQIMNGEIINYSANDTRRVDLVASCGYEDNLDDVRKVLTDIVSKDDRVLEDPAPTIAVSELADSSVNFVVRPWVATDDYWGVYFDLTEQIKKRFDAEGIAIPFPQRDVHVYQHAET